MLSWLFPTTTKKQKSVNYFYDVCIRNALFLTADWDQISKATLYILKHQDPKPFMYLMPTTYFNEDSSFRLRSDSKASIFHKPRTWKIKDQLSDDLFVVASQDGKQLVGRISKNTSQKKFLKEAIAHLSLSCGKKCYRENVGDVESPIPNLFAVVKTQTDNIILLYEKFEHNLLDFIQKSSSKSDIYDVMVQIIYKLYMLQKSSSFLHGNLHHNNVFIRKRTSTLDKVYLLPGNVAIKTRSNYKIFFMDFSDTCVSKMNCSQSTPPGFTNTTRKLYDDKENSRKRCFNKSFDLILLFASLASFKIGATGTRLGDFLAHFTAPFSLHKNQNSPNDWKKIYKKYMEENKSFEPKNVLKWLLNYQPNRQPDFELPPPIRTLEEEFSDKKIKKAQQAKAKRETQRQKAEKQKKQQKNKQQQKKQQKKTSTNLDCRICRNEIVSLAALHLAASKNVTSNELTGKALHKIYLFLSKALHPDKGGNKESFQRLLNCKELLESKVCK